MIRPTALYPTLLKGTISGPIRCESLDGTEIWLPPQKGILQIPPFKQDGKMFGVSHLQKKSHYFSLTFEPYIYHWGWFPHLQEQDGNGGWKPGTEIGLYWRTGGWRWQVPDAKSDWTPWIHSGGRIIGTHLD